jgi:Rps23 Pro-64 3,4-dihydroxylase Tpa1-like proline 4-hydroxylase
MEQLALCCYGVEVRVRDSAGLGLIAHLQVALPPEFTTPDGSSQSVLEYAVTADSVPGESGCVEYAVSCDGAEVFATSSDDEVFNWLRRDIHQSVARRATQCVFVHAAVVGWRGLAIVIPGRHQSGKSTLVAELVRRGAMYYSDLFAVLDDDGRVHAYRATPELSDGQPQDLRLVRDGRPAALPIGLIVAGEYAPSVIWQPRIVRGAHAVLPLVDSTVLAREAVPRMRDIAARIAEHGIALRGARPEATEVATRVLDLVDDTLVSHAAGALGEGTTPISDELARVADIWIHQPLARPISPPRRLAVTPYVRVPDFLSSADHAYLLEHTLASEADFKDSGVITDEGKGAVDHEARKSRTLHGPGLERVWHLFERRIRAMLPYVRQQLNMPWFALGHMERQLTVHGSGGFFAPHVDTGHPIAEKRRISGVYYFNRNPRRFRGGELRLYDTWITPDGTTGAATSTTLEALDNSIVFFPSDSFHEVCAVQAESSDFGGGRFTVTIWFHAAPDNAT